MSEISTVLNWLWIGKIAVIVATVEPPNSWASPRSFTFLVGRDGETLISGGLPSERVISEVRHAFGQAAYDCY